MKKIVNNDILHIQHKLSTGTKWHKRSGSCTVIAVKSKFWAEQIYAFAIGIVADSVAFSFRFSKGIVEVASTRIPITVDAIGGVIQPSVSAVKTATEQQNM